MFAAINILRSPTGRAFVAIRDSEIAAQSLGVNLGLYKALSFAISGAFTGLAGALLAHSDDVEYYRGTTGTHGFFDW